MSLGFYKIYMKCKYEFTYTTTQRGRYRYDLSLYNFKILTVVSFLKTTLNICFSFLRYHIYDEICILYCNNYKSTLLESIIPY